MKLLKIGKHKLKTPAVCGSVIGRTLNEIKSGMDRAVKGGTDLVELRIDGLRDRAGWKKLLSGRIPVVLTNRPKREGGFFDGQEDTRLEILREGIEAGVPCIDIELSTTEKLRDPLVADAKALGVTVLISYHNFFTTPSTDTLAKTMKNMVEAGCDIAKLVTFAKNSTHALRTLDFLVQAQKISVLPVIAFAMGEAGRITRFVAPVFGSPWIYVGVGKKTATGQLDIATAKKWVRELARMEVRN
ncbi:MAG TPA: type I 3-dehydroquinate dehydratase [Hadesarchaea archaeon]|nr:type I 3-dehydroquinate dehydratase [Hadesarchaea archaeon]